ncbi:alpha/beta hydrolase [Planctomycetota bacterium]
MTTTEQSAESTTVAQHSEGEFRTADGLKLYRQTFVPETVRANVVFLHGFLDHSSRYLHVFDELNRKGIALYTYDMRGHGRSEGRRGHVRSYDQFDSDLGIFLELVGKEIGETAPFLLAHSNGALVGTRFLLEQPAAVRGVVYSSPYFQNAIKPNILELFLAHVVGRAIPVLPITAPLPVTALTHDPEWLERAEQDPLRGRKLTPGWYRSLLATQAEVTPRAAEFKLPLLIVQAGDDKVANPPASKQFSEACGSEDKEYRECPGLYHEVFMESPDKRNEIIDTVVSWFVERM